MPNHKLSKNVNNPFGGSVCHVVGNKLQHINLYYIRQIGPKNKKIYPPATCMKSACKQDMTLYKHTESVCVCVCVCARACVCVCVRVCVRVCV